MCVEHDPNDKCIHTPLRIKGQCLLYMHTASYLTTSPAFTLSDPKVRHPDKESSDNLPGDPPAFIPI